MMNWKWFCIEGILLMILGVIALLQPSIAAEAIAMLIGWLLVIAGLVAVIGGISHQSGPRSPVAFGGGLVTLIFGFLLLILPAPALATVTIIVAIFFLIAGIAELFSALLLRTAYGVSNHCGLAFFHGLLCVLFGLALLAFWPTSLVVIGIIVGMNLCVTGAYLISLSWYVRTLPTC
tara:strand:+ start:296 stop:826 length:531 start_codon:yes stop_codon:yes gene_type:complete